VPSPTPGTGGFVKMDFHVHTPVSYCYDDNMERELGLRTEPSHIVQAALDAGLNAMVVSDHNAVTNIRPMQAAAAGTGLVIFPAIELTTQGGHLLAIFDPEDDVDRMARLLDQLEFPEAQYGNGSYSTHFWLDECARAVVDFGGLAIAAHIDREPRGFTAGYFDRDIKKRIHNSDFLTALEITDPRSKPDWEQGKVRHYPKPYPIVQGSDAHGHREVGRRPTHLYVTECTLAGFRQAFAHYTDFVKFPRELAFEGAHTD
jgi:PHP family Zn ribbon phosphoesterase